MSEEISRKEFLQSELVDLEKQLTAIADAKVKYLESAAIATKRTETGIKFCKELIAKEV